MPPYIQRQHVLNIFLQDDIQIELSHVIADIRIAAECDAISACFDSGLAEQMIVTACIKSNNRRCIPTMDLRETDKSSM